MAAKHMQSAALPYRIASDGQIEVRLVRTGRSHRWSLPKGRVKPGLSYPDNAAAEAFEEAGVSGRVDSTCALICRRFKTVSDDEKLLVEVLVYPLLVQTQHARWPERKTRDAAWFAAAHAAVVVDEPAVADLILRLAAGHPLSTSDVPARLCA